MNCNKVRNLLSAYMDGELLGYEHRLIGQHLQRCFDCRTEYEELLQMKRLLGAMRVHDPGQQRAAAILQRCAADAQAARGVQFGEWRLSVPRLRTSGPLFTPIMGLGAGLACFGLIMMSHPAAPVSANAVRGTLVFEPANLARDEPPAPNVSELTNGLMRESGPRPAGYEPHYSIDLPNYPPRPRLTRRASSPLIDAGLGR
ncbi:MAG TPA: zf-HC2 domain-containing protein [Chthonomonadaceae bacterium]|nr:zf-HC2 domain-containing protein [Chthonomonadaceae bacterium]